MFAVPGAQGEGSPHEQGSRHSPEAGTYPLADADHVEDDGQDEEGEQSSREDEEVLRLESLELNRAADTLVYGIFSHCRWLKEERT